MKRMPDIDINDIIEKFRTAESGQSRRVDGGHDSPEVQAEQVMAMHRAAANPEVNIRTRCVGCDGDVSIVECALCVCGRFVCRRCAELEEDDVCDHNYELQLAAFDADND